MVGTQMSLSVNEKGCLGYSSASSPSEENIILTLNLDGHGPMTYVSAEVEPTYIKRASSRGFWLRSRILHSMRKSEGAKCLSTCRIYLLLEQLALLRVQSEVRSLESLACFLQVIKLPL
jgi:hypothetical protein